MDKMTLDELFQHVLTIVADYRLNYQDEFSEHEKRRAIQIFLAFDEFMIDNLEGYCTDDRMFDFTEYASYQLDILEGK